MVGLQLGLEDLAKYPFLREAGDYVRQHALNLNDMAEPDFENILLRASDRVLEVAAKRRVTSALSEPDTELLSFPVALMLVRATRLEHLASQYAHAEAVRVEGFLEEELDAVIAEMFRSVLNIHLTEVTPGGYGYGIFDFKIPAPDYLTRASKFHELQWKLVNRVVDRGHVYLKKHDLIRLIRDEIKNIILGKIKTLVVPKLPENMERYVKQIIAASPIPPKFEIDYAVTPDIHPPCAIHALEMLQEGENVPHHGRFLMATYLLSVGKTVDDIVNLFPRAPDFNERITRYQVEHIAGLKGGRTKYKVPSCRTLQTHSFCYKTSACSGIVNPLQFGRKSYAVKKGRRIWTRRQPRS